MIEGGRRTCFLFESLHSVRIVGKVCGKNFDRHFTIKPGVASAINFARVTCADLGNDRVMCERRIGGDGFAQYVCLKSREHNAITCSDQSRLFDDGIHSGAGKLTGVANLNLVVASERLENLGVASKFALRKSCHYTS